MEDFSFYFFKTLKKTKTKRTIKKASATKPNKVPSKKNNWFIKTFPEAWKVTQELRDAGINTEIDMLDRNVSKNFDYANVMGIPYVIVIGPEEVKEQKIKVKDMLSGKEEVTTAKQFIKKVNFSR